MKIDSPKDVSAIERNLRNISKHRVGLSAINNIESFLPEIMVKNEEGKDLKVKMINYQNTEINNAVQSVFERFCFNNDIIFRKTYYSIDLIIYKIINAKHATVDKLQEFEAIESIRFMPNSPLD